MAEKHSTVVGGSSAGLRLKCNASIEECKKVPADTSIYAATGTALHKIVELAWAEELSDEEVLLRFTGAKFADLLTKDEEIEEFGHHVIEEDHIKNKVLPTLAFLDSLVDENTEFASELEVSFAPHEQSPYNSQDEPFEIQGAFGTLDFKFIIWNGKKVARCGIVDFKMGDGILVSPKDNDQFRFYLAACVHSEELPDVEDYEAWVFQPAASLDPSKYASKEIYSARDIDQFAFDLREAIEGAPVHHIGPHCKRCRGKIVCKSYQAWIAGTQATQIEGINNRELADRLDLCETLKAYIKEVHAAAARAAQDGVIIPGWQFGPGEGHSEWKNEEAAWGALGRLGLSSQERATRKTISPAQALKLLQEKGVEPKVIDKFRRRHIHRPATAGRLTRTPEGELDGNGLRQLAARIAA
jgi:hypothetical protein